MGGNLLAGLLWDIYGPSATFLMGAGITAVALVGLAALRGSGRSLPDKAEE